MKLIVKTGDDAASGNIVEAGFDRFFITEGPTAINENDNENLILNAYPNPFSDETTIAYDMKTSFEGAMMVVSDITGRQIEKVYLSQSKGTIVINNLTAGIYFVNIINGNQISVPVKIVKTQ
jgi:hypothetical protein